MSFGQQATAYSQNGRRGAGIKVPLPEAGEGFRVRAAKLGCTLSQVQLKSCGFLEDKTLSLDLDKV